MTTAAIRQLSKNEMTNAVAVSVTFCTIVERRSARALRTSVASVAKIDVKDPVLFSSTSNHPISFFRIAAPNKDTELKLQVGLVFSNTVQTGMSQSNYLTTWATTNKKDGENYPKTSTSEPE